MIARDAALERYSEDRTLESRQRVIEEHQYLCRRAARKFARDGVDRNDLEQVAAIGLIKAVDRFDAAQGTPFEGYAWRFVLGELMHYVRDSERMVRAPRRARQLERRYAVAERELSASLQRTPLDVEIIEHLGVSSEQRHEIERYRETSSVVSTDALCPTQLSALAYTMDDHIDRMAIEDGLNHLNSIEREVIVEIYERDTPVTELAHRLGYSRRHVTRIHRGALRKLAPVTRPRW